MSYLPYNEGDAIRRAVPEAGHCVDCLPTYERPRSGSGFQMHSRCSPLNTVDRIALILHRQETPCRYPG